MMDVENQDTVKCTSNRVVEKDFQTTLNTEKALKPFKSRAFNFIGYLGLQVAERVGFEPTYQLITGNSISSRARYGRFATSPSSERL